MLLPHLDHIELGNAVLLHTHGHGDAILLNEHDDSWRERDEGGIGKIDKDKGRKGWREGIGRGKRRDSGCSYM